MTGTSPSSFEPDSTTTRAMTAMVLWRMAGEPEPQGLDLFSDVDRDAWYAKAVAWASEAGVAHGYGEAGTFFGPEDKVTREQLATFLMRFASHRPLDLIACRFVRIRRCVRYRRVRPGCAVVGRRPGAFQGHRRNHDACAPGRFDARPDGRAPDVLLPHAGIVKWRNFIVRLAKAVKSYFWNTEAAPAGRRPISLIRKVPYVRIRRIHR